MIYLFFIKNDINNNIKSFIHKLKSLTFQAKLGSMYYKSMRNAYLSRDIGNILGANVSDCFRAGYLSKFDLVSNLVSSFPNLQGIVGKYYSKMVSENKLVCEALEQQYWPKFSGDNIPDNTVSQSLAIADRFDFLLGMFFIGHKVTGDRDPFALRRAAVGILYIFSPE